MFESITEATSSALDLCVLGKGHEGVDMSDWVPDPNSRCQRIEPFEDPVRGWGKPNGTIGCDVPEHAVNEPPPPGLSREVHVAWVVDHAPPLNESQREKLRRIFDSVQSGESRG